MCQELPFTFITETNQLHDLIRIATREGLIAIDTESDSKIYDTQLSLIQISTKHENFIIDPLSPNIDFSLFKFLLKTPKILKLFYEPRFDVFLLKTKGLAPITNIFDLAQAYVMSMLENTTQKPSLFKILEKEFNVTLDCDKKSISRSSWSKRPLSKKHLAYAVTDTYYLHDLYALVKPILQRKHLYGHVKRYSEAYVLTPVISPSIHQSFELFKYQAFQDLSLEKKLVAQKINAFRHALARKKNIKTSMIISSKRIIELSSQAFQDPSELKQFIYCNQKYHRLKYKIEIIWNYITHADTTQEENERLKLQLQKDLELYQQLHGDLSLLNKNKTIKLRIPLDTFSKRITALKNWRNKYSSHTHLPKQLVLHDLTITALAKIPLNGKTRLYSLPGYSGRFKQKTEQEILEILRENNAVLN